MPVAALCALSSGLVAARGVIWLTLSKGFFIPCSTNSITCQHAAHISLSIQGIQDLAVQSCAQHTQQKHGRPNSAGMRAEQPPLLLRWHKPRQQQSLPQTGQLAQACNRTYVTHRVGLAK